MKHMRTIVEINNLTRKRIDPSFVKKIVRKTVKLSGEDLNLVKLSIVFVKDSEMRKINRKYRKNNKSTDVLSFRYDLGYNKKKIEGEIVLCPDVIAKHACENKIGFSRELAFVLAHGILHLLDFRHGKRMYELQDAISAKLKNQDVK